MILSKIDNIGSFIKELEYHNPEFKLYENDLGKIFESLLLKNAVVFFNSTGKRCIMNPPDQYKSYYFLNLGIKGYKETIFIIYSILHELGHLLDNITPLTDKKTREIRAWELAKEELYKYPSIVDEDKFTEHRNTCLASYSIFS